MLVFVNVGDEVAAVELWKLEFEWKISFNQNTGIDKNNLELSGLISAVTGVE
jgi:hypothetical protein